VVVAPPSLLTSVVRFGPLPVSKLGGATTTPVPTPQPERHRLRLPSGQPSVASLSRYGPSIQSDGQSPAAAWWFIEAADIQKYACPPRKTQKRQGNVFIFLQQLKKKLLLRRALNLTGLAPEANLGVA